MKFMMKKKTLAGLAVVSLVTFAGISQRAPVRAADAKDAKPAVGVPMFQVDPEWPKLPNNWIMGDPTSVAVDRHDNVWILTRPRTVPADKKDRASPNVLALDKNGKLLRSWGGPSDAYEWPDTEHGIYVDHKDRVWITGNNPIAQVRLTQRSDDMLLQFTREGKFVRQFGHRDQSTGNKDTNNFKGPADVFVNRRTNEAFVADGYMNRRVILDRQTLEVLGRFGEAGETPGNFRGLHHLAVDSKGNIYTAEVATGRRAQKFVFKGFKPRS
jgi:DNA-binding beta-propeller fold protein YncE